MSQGEEGRIGKSPVKATELLSGKLSVLIASYIFSSTDGKLLGLKKFLTKLPQITLLYMPWKHHKLANINLQEPTLPPGHGLKYWAEFVLVQVEWR